jgi:hypothetical protein
LADDDEEKDAKKKQSNGSQQSAHRRRGTCSRELGAFLVTGAGSSRTIRRNWLNGVSGAAGGNERRKKPDSGRERFRDELPCSRPRPRHNCTTSTTGHTHTRTDEDSEGARRVPGAAQSRKHSSSSSSSPSVSVVCCLSSLSPLNLPFCEIVHQ